MPIMTADFDEALSALADPTRRAILDRLALGEARVTQLAAPFPISLNAVSKHIRMLERARLVNRRRSGREHLLSLNAEVVESTAEWLDSRRALWTARLDALEQALRDEDRVVGEITTPAATEGAWYEHA